LNIELERAMGDWKDECDGVAAGLIRGGTPPWDAVRRAREVVSRRRRMRAIIEPKGSVRDLIRRAGL
jgi:hypothetical protein